ncbi:MAG TPA: thiamine pyrophosphate-dependent dehydrogenase E1 component subunit alpha [Patescibacteria group bacterium]|nr:thiamine pyrophosphate-dependent dehydrogenase E1 component subunit alpha [Patescibacteria group bacterium]
MRNWKILPQHEGYCLENVLQADAIEMFRKLSLIRAVQLKIEELYHHDEMKTPVHLCIGQEAIAVGVCQALKKSDYVFSNHRGHGHYLAKGGDLRAMIAELYCKETGCSHGRGGSMHLVDVDAGLPGSSSIVAGGIPLAVGAAFSSSRKETGLVSVAFFGDGAADEGVLYESINFAVLEKLPVLFVCENNFYAVCSPIFGRHAHDGIFKRFMGMGIPCHKVDGTNVLEVYKLFRKLAADARSGDGPAFIECPAYRWRGHSGAGSDVNMGYRSQDELDLWAKRCPVESYRDFLLNKGVITVTELKNINEKVDSDIEAAFIYAQKSALPAGNDLMKWLFSYGKG